ncbi:MAG: ABC transporter ATP-binding protein [Christensenellales bacterium]|jgi:ATP-binding cassette subfamily B multidrug efflux pump
MIKKLLASVREYKKPSLLAPLSISMEVVMEVLMPFLMAIMIDQGVQARNMDVIARMGTLVILCCGLSLLFGVLAGKFAAVATAGFSKNLRRDMYHKVQTFSFANIDRFSTASIITRMTTDVTNVQNAYSMIIRMAVRCPLMLIFAMIMSFRINVQLSLIFLATVPILTVGLLWIAKSVYPVFEAMFKKMDKMNLVVQENLHGIRVVKSFVREDYETDKFKEASDAVYRLNVRAERLLAFFGPLMQFCMNGCMLIVSYLGAKLIIGAHGAPDGLTTGYLTSLLSYAGQILSSLMMVSMAYVMTNLSRPAAERIVEILDEEADIYSPEDPVSEVADGSIVFENAGFSYSKREDNLCLEGINLSIRSGETVGILGGTGSSKTSLVQLIPRLYDATIGSVKVGGRDVREYDIAALRENVAMVLQKNELFAGTIYQNLRWGNEEATDEEVERAAQLAQADGFVRSFPDGYNTFIEQGGTNLSGGQKQRLCIARAILKKPKILILDDSTSAVDTKTDALIRKAFREEIPDTTKLIIAQRVASVEDADKILVLDGGRVNGFGTHEELLENNRIYREVYESQRKGAAEE